MEEISWEQEMRNNVEIDELSKSKLLDTCEFLWELLDNIDTAGDMAKGDDKLYRAIVERNQKRRWETGIKCDGYVLDLSSLKEN